MKEGALVFEGALSEDEVEAYLEAIDRITKEDPKYDAGKFYGPDNIVERDPLFAALIDHPRHLGYVYDLYGELLKLHLSQFFLSDRETAATMPGIRTGPAQSPRGSSLPTCHSRSRSHTG